MGEIEIGTLDVVPVREVWPREDTNFTPWLADNPQLVSDALGMDLELDGREVKVGNYSVDLVFKEASSDTVVVIENMYGSTDHDHLGKLITYAAGMEADYAVLVAEDFRPEHRSALNWLNSVSTEDRGFFGLGLEAWKIGDSVPAPRLRVVVQPDDWSRSVRVTRQDTALETLYRRFWEGIQTAMRAEGSYWAGTGRPIKVKYGVFKSRQGVGFHIAFCRPRKSFYGLRCEAYIDTRDKQGTQELYEYLESRRSEIEERFEGAEPLEWEPMEGRRASRISVYFPDSIRVREEDKWPAAQKWAVSTLRQLRSAVDLVLDELLEND